MKILIVEDSKAIAQLQTFIIQTDNDLSFEINHALLVEEGLKLNEQIKPDLLILDLNFPDSSIEKTIEKIPSFKTYARFVIVASGHDDPAIEQQVIDKGADKFIHKNSFSFSNREGIQRLINQLLSN